MSGTAVIAHRALPTAQLDWPPRPHHEGHHLPDDIEDLISIDLPRGVSTNGIILPFRRAIHPHECVIEILHFADFTIIIGHAFRIRQAPTRVRQLPFAIIQKIALLSLMMQ
jgi:hypothetical protein